MALKYRVYHSNAKPVFEALATLVALGENLAPPLDLIGAAWADFSRLSFTESATPTGKAWAPLTSRQGQPLLDTGRLRNSITHLVQGNTLEIGTNWPWAHVHQFGAEIVPVRAKLLRFTVGGARGRDRVVFAKKVVIPARPFLPVSDIPASWREVAVQIISSFVSSATDKV